MSGASETGMRMANMPSGDFVSTMRIKHAGIALTSPSPARTLKHLGGDIRADERVDDEGRRDQRGDKSAPLQRRDVGDDDLGEQLQARVAHGIQDDATADGLNVVRGGDHDVADDVEDHWM